MRKFQRPSDSLLVGKRDIARQVQESRTSQDKVQSESEVCGKKVWGIKMVVVPAS